MMNLKVRLPEPEFGGSGLMGVHRRGARRPMPAPQGGRRRPAVLPLPNSIARGDDGIPP